MTATGPGPASPTEPDGEPAFLEGFDDAGGGDPACPRGPTERSRRPDPVAVLAAAPLTGGTPRRVRDLAEVAGIAPSTATRILDALERRAIISRSRSDHDRRGVTVSLTAFGRRR